MGFWEDRRKNKKNADRTKAAAAVGEVYRKMLFENRPNDYIPEDTYTLKDIRIRINDEGKITITLASDKVDDYNCEICVSDGYKILYKVYGASFGYGREYKNYKDKINYGAVYSKKSVLERLIPKDINENTEFTKEQLVQLERELNEARQKTYDGVWILQKVEVQNPNFRVFGENIVSRKLHKGQKLFIRNDPRFNKIQYAQTEDKNIDILCVDYTPIEMRYVVADDVTKIDLNRSVFNVSFMDEELGLAEVNLSEIFTTRDKYMDALPYTRFTKAALAFRMEKIQEAKQNENVSTKKTSIKK